MLSVNTIVLNPDDVLKEGVREVYATIRNDYGKDEHGNKAVGKEWGFWLWGIGLRESHVKAGFASAEEAQIAARLAYEESRTPRVPPPGKRISEFDNLRGGVKAKEIFGQILALMKAFHLLEPSASPALKRSFFAGNGTLRHPVTSGGITWWVTKRGIEILKGLVDKAIASDPTLAGGDRDLGWSHFSGHECVLAFTSFPH